MSSELDNALNLAPIEELEKTADKLVQASQENDFQYVRENLYDVIDKSREALDSVMQLAQQSQHPRAYEVLNQLLRTVADVSNNLTDLHIKRTKIEVDKQRSGVGNINNRTINNNVFVGTTADIQKLLANLPTPLDEDNIIDV
jgi:hypothetical protein